MTAVLPDPAIAGRDPIQPEGAGVGVFALEDWFTPFATHVESLPADRSMALFASIRGWVDALEVETLASALTGGTADARVATLARSAGHSKHAVRRATKRAEAVHQNPVLATKLRTGALTTEQVDAIADAAAKSDGSAAADGQLIADVEASPVDQARVIVKRWMNDREDPDQTEAKYDKQRRLRGLRRFATKDGLEAITAAGDSASIEEAWNRLTQDADLRYRLDGGRDLPAGSHKTSHPQRMFDAFIGRITGHITNDESGHTTPAPRANAGRPTVMVATTLNPATGEISGAELAGGGRLPPSVLDRMMCNADIIAAAFDTNGEILWQGRKIRSATAAQFKALVARDGGCVLCGAHYLRCDAHHLMPWHAPGRGETNVDQMALLCDSCHHIVHDQKLTLERAAPAARKPGHNAAETTDPDSRTDKADPAPDRQSIRWHTRPATPNETPPPRPTRC
ncbi:MAG: DUF222 domain-containing protein [Acidimicrobiales bacterium]|nr:DUF222 domain-containing protein [Acidimicrobiales bacterium]